MLRPSSFGKPAKQIRTVLENETLMTGRPYHVGENAAFQRGVGSLRGNDDEMVGCVVGRGLE